MTSATDYGRPAAQRRVGSVKNITATTRRLRSWRKIRLQSHRSPPLNDVEGFVSVLHYAIYYLWSLNIKSRSQEVDFPKF